MPAQDPHNLSRWLLSFELRKIENGANRGMPCTKHSHDLIRIAQALTAEDVGHTIGDACRMGGFADCFKAIGAGWVGCAPSARSVNYCIGMQRRGSFAIQIANFEESAVSTRGFHLVKPD